MKIVSISLICIFFIIQLISCNKEETKTPDVYICGYERNTSGNYDAVIWKNGEKQILGKTIGQSSSFARDIFVNGTDVYVAGEAQIGATTTAVVWKNGVWGSPIDGSAGRATSIFVNGSDVYAAGSQGGKAAIWKNGMGTILSASLSEALDIYVSGSDVYACGYKSNGSVFVRAVWKNGTELPYIVSASKESRAQSMKVVGDDVYVSGYEDLTPGNAIGRIWKNGTEIFSNTDYYSYDKIDIAGTDVYSSGIGGSAGAANSIIAKNNISLYTTIAPPSTVIYGLKLYNKDVYYCGEENDNQAIFWKNGQRTVLPSTDVSRASEIFIK